MEDPYHHKKSEKKNIFLTASSPALINEKSSDKKSLSLTKRVVRAVSHEPRPTKSSPRMKKTSPRITTYNDDHTEETVNTAFKHDNTYLILATQENNDTAVKNILSYKTVQINQQNQGGNTALHYAALNENTIILNLLLDDDRTKVMIENKKGNTPLECLTCPGMYNKHINKVYYKFKLKEKLQNNIPLSPLFSAFFTQDGPDIDQLKHLIAQELSININEQDDSGNTLLHYALLSRNKTAIKLLISAITINLDITNEKGQKPQKFCIKATNDKKGKKINLLVFIRTMLNNAIHEESFEYEVNRKIVTIDDIVKKIKMRLLNNYEEQTKNSTDNTHNDRQLPIDTILPDYATDEFIAQIIKYKTNSRQIDGNICNFRTENNSHSSSNEEYKKIDL